MWISTVLVSEPEQDRMTWDHQMTRRSFTARELVEPTETRVCISRLQMYFGSFKLTARPVNLTFFSLRKTLCPLPLFGLNKKAKTLSFFFLWKEIVVTTLFLKTCHFKDTAALDCPSHSTCGLQRKLVYKKKRLTKLFPKYISGCLKGPVWKMQRHPVSRKQTVLHLTSHLSRTGWDVRVKAKPQAEPQSGPHDGATYPPPCWVDQLVL